MLKIHAIKASSVNMPKTTPEDVVKYGKTHEEWEAEEAAERKTIKGKIKYAWEDYLYYPVIRAKNRVFDLKDDAIAFVQRGKRGYASRDAWGVSHYLDSFMPELLRHMIDDSKGGGNGYPGVAGAENAKKWQAMIEKMAKGFEASRQQEDLWADSRFKDIVKHRKEYDRLEEIRIEGMELFVKWYAHLWD